jgi:prophage DNA circulation protein
MYKFEAVEAAPLCERVLSVLLTQAPTRGRPGSDLRTAIGDFITRSLYLLKNDLSGPPLLEIFELARETGITFAQFEVVRNAASLEAPTTIGATIIKNALIEFALATECEIIANTTFVSRNDVDVVQQAINDAFEPMQEVAADDMAQAAYQALIGLHAAAAFYLAQTALPLPRMLRYRFYDSLPSVVMAYKLYADASRCDELRAENAIVHPAFMQLTGRALAN